MPFRLLILLLICSTIGHAVAGEKDSSYTLYLVRHAEKVSDDSGDPVLTQAGKTRSDQIANWLKDKDIQEIWSSDYFRTRDTAKPLASMLGLELNIYDPRNQAVLVEALLENQHTALIAGHSNTIPELARLICACYIEDMEDSEYDRMIVILMTDGETRVKTLSQTKLFKPQGT